MDLPTFIIRHGPVQAWSEEQVVLWATEAGLAGAIVTALQSEEVDGAALFELSTEEIRDELKLVLGQRKALERAITTLQRADGTRVSCATKGAAAGMNPPEVSLSSQAENQAVKKKAERKEKLQQAEPELEPGARSRTRKPDPDGHQEDLAPRKAPQQPQHPQPPPPQPQPPQPQPQPQPGFSLDHVAIQAAKVKAPKLKAVCQGTILLCLAPA